MFEDQFGVPSLSDEEIPTKSLSDSSSSIELDHQTPKLVRIPSDASNISYSSEEDLAGPSTLPVLESKFLSPEKNVSIDEDLKESKIKATNVRKRKTVEQVGSTNETI